MLNFNSIIVFSQNPTALVEFYKKVFQKDPDWMGGEFTEFQVGSGFVTFGPHDNVHGKNQNPERIMFNFETEDVKGEFTRIKGLGATSVAQPYTPGEDSNMTMATLSDPDGNFFQLMTPMKM